MRLCVLCLIACATACGPAVERVPCTDQSITEGDLVITEVFPSATGMDPGKEWFEIYNASDRAVELEGLTLVHGDKLHAMTEVVIAPGQFFTLGDTDNSKTLPYVDYGYGDDLGDLAGSGGELKLECGSKVIDQASYADVVAGHSRELTAGQPPDASINDDPVESWCQGNATEFAAGNFGTPGQDNDCIPLVVGECDDEGTARGVMPPVAGDVVITEVMASPTKVPDASGEWFELTALADVDLNGVGLDRGGDAATPEVIDTTTCFHVRAGGHVVFARSDDSATNGMLPRVDGTFSFALVSGTASAPGDLKVVLGTEVLDEIRWTSSPNGASISLDPTRTDTIANDDPSNSCAGVRGYGLGDLGTPGEDNTGCSLLPPAGMCDDNGTLRAIVTPPAGALVIDEVMPNPSGDETKREWFEITNAGTTAFDLNDLSLDRVDDSRMPDSISASACKSVAPGAFAVFARSNDPAINGGLPSVDATFGFTMVNSAGEARILAADGTTVVAEATWTTTKDGVAIELDGASTCPAVSSYGDGMLGTPGLANDACP